MDRIETRPPRSRLAELLHRIETHRNLVEPLVGRRCARITIDRSDPPLVLTFLYDGPTARVEVNAPFRFNLGTESWRLDPWDDRRALAPVLSLVDRTVSAAAADEGGGLRLEFSGGAVIEVDTPENMTEPWWFDMVDEVEDPTPER